MKRAALILSQPFERYLGADHVICADAGYARAREKGIKVDLVVGDMDSLGYLPKEVETVLAPVMKDFSDGELGVRQAALGNWFFLDIYGALGGRFDHSLYNTHLLRIADKLGIRAVIRGDHCDVYYAEGNALIDVTPGDSFSIVPFSEEVHIIKSKGLKYPADGAVLTKGDTIGLSNECTESSVFVGIREGSALLIHSFA